jgi:hypothetical protein
MVMRGGGGTLQIVLADVRLPVPLLLVIRKLHQAGEVVRSARKSGPACIGRRTVTIAGYRHRNIGPFNFADTVDRLLWSAAVPKALFRLNLSRYSSSRTIGRASLYICAPV